MQKSLCFFCRRTNIYYNNECMYILYIKFVIALMPSSGASAHAKYICIRTQNTTVTTIPLPFYIMCVQAGGCMLTLLHGLFLNSVLYLSTIMRLLLIIQYLHILTLHSMLVQKVDGSGEYVQKGDRICYIMCVHADTFVWFIIGFLFISQYHIMSLLILFHY